MKLLTLMLTLFAASLALAGEAKVTVHLLDHTDEKKTEARFWIDWCDNWRGIVETKTVTGKAADEIILQLQKSLEDFPSDNKCGHDPIYGVEVLHEDGSTFKTSICFSCNTWVKPKTRMSVAGGHGINNELCKKLREVVELPAELLPKAEAKAE